MRRKKPTFAREIDDFISLTRREKENRKDCPAIESLDGADLYRPEPSPRQEALLEYRNNMLGYDPAARLDYIDGVRAWPFWRLKKIPLQLREIGAEYGALCEQVQSANSCAAAVISDQVDGGFAGSGEMKILGMIDRKKLADRAINARPIAIAPKDGNDSTRKTIHSDTLMLNLLVEGLSIGEILERSGWSAKKNSPYLIDSFRFCCQRVGLAWGYCGDQLEIDHSQKTA